MPGDEETNGSVLLQPSTKDPTPQDHRRPRPVEPDIVQLAVRSLAPPRRLPLDLRQAVLDAGHGAHVESIGSVEGRRRGSFGGGGAPMFPPRFSDVKFNGRG